MKLGNPYTAEELSAIVLAFWAEITDLNRLISNLPNYKGILSLRREDLERRVYEINNRIIEALEL